MEEARAGDESAVENRDEDGVDGAEGRVEASSCFGDDGLDAFEVPSTQAADCERRVQLTIRLEALLSKLPVRETCLLDLAKPRCSPDEDRVERDVDRKSVV